MGADADAGGSTGCSYTTKGSAPAGRMDHKGSLGCRRRWLSWSLPDPHSRAGESPLQPAGTILKRHDSDLMGRNIPTVRTYVSARTGAHYGTRASSGFRFTKRISPILPKQAGTLVP